jgi:hypothetical protein
MSSLRQLHPIEYRTWKAIRARCNSPSLANMGNYQKKGIKVCERWNSFANFYSDMGDRPEGHTIDRIDPEGDYCPENCRWASWDTQAKNRGDFNINITYNGKTQCLKDWAKEYHIYYQTLVARIKRFPKLSFEEILNYKDPRKEKITWQGKEYSRDELCEIHNIPKANFYDRVHKGWDIERILTTPVKKITTINK